jgi:hypothetical protein
LVTAGGEVDPRSASNGKDALRGFFVLPLNSFGFRRYLTMKSTGVEV